MPILVHPVCFQLAHSSQVGLNSLREIAPTGTASIKTIMIYYGNTYEMLHPLPFGDQETVYLHFQHRETTKMLPSYKVLFKKQRNRWNKESRSLSIVKILCHGWRKFLLPDRGFAYTMRNCRLLLRYIFNATTSWGCDSWCISMAICFLRTGKKIYLWNVSSVTTYGKPNDDSYIPNQLQ